MNEKSLKALSYVVAGVMLAVIIVGVVTRGSVASGKYKPLAQCLKDKGAMFYGAFWCPHCQKTKQMFGDAVSLLPYVECSTPDGKDQTQICKDKNIDGYPTWIFANGERAQGELTFDTLAQKTGCTVPQ